MLLSWKSQVFTQIENKSQRYNAKLQNWKERKDAEAKPGESQRDS